MKKTLAVLMITLCILTVVLIGSYDARRTVAAPLIPQRTDRPITPTTIPTQTPVPTATIGYAATLQIAQATLDETRRVNAMITAEHEQREIEKISMAHDEIMAQEANKLASINATGTAYPTTVSLAMTEHAIEIAQLTLESSRITATAQAPTQLASIMQVETSVRYARLDRAFRIGFLVVVTIFLLSVSAFILRLQPPVQTDDKLESQELPDHIEIWLRDEKNPATSEHYVFPCSDEQLTELAEMVVNGERTFGYNRMETSSRTFKGRRETLEKTRAVLEKAKLANNTHAGESVVNDRGVEFFERWFETHKLPDGFEMEATSPESENV